MVSLFECTSYVRSVVTSLEISQAFSLDIKERFMVDAGLLDIWKT